MAELVKKQSPDFWAGEKQQRNNKSSHIAHDIRNIQKVDLMNDKVTTIIVLPELSFRHRAKKVKTLMNPI